MQIKIKVRHHFTPPRIATVTEHTYKIIQKEKITGISEVWKNCNVHRGTDTKGKLFDETSMSPT